MSATDPTFPDTVDEGARAAFEAAWHDGPPPDLADYVPPADHPHHRATVEELVCIDLEMRWGAADVERPRVEDYLRRFPVLSDPAVVLRLAKEEYRAREMFGHRPPVAEFRERFPALLTGADGFAETLPPRPAATEQTLSVPGYEVIELLGRGGMGVVYRARHLGLDRIVALKVLSAASLAEAEDQERFRREAEAIARLNHPHVVQIFDVGQADGRPFFALEYVSGGSLAQHLAAGLWPPSESSSTLARSRAAAQLVHDVAEAVEHAHRGGVLHRDLKPGNLLMAVDGRPKVTDFGLATDLAQSSALTRTGDILGTPSYMAPEQALGRTAGVGSWTDVYALGAILYELLTGRPPFKADTIANTIYLVVHEEPVAPGQLQPGLPRDLETICLKAMSKESHRRYATAGELADDLRRYLEHRPIRARRVGPVGRLGRWCRRNPTLAATIALAVLAIMSVAGIGFWRVVAERDRYRGERDRAQANLYRSLVSDAEAQMQGRDTGWWWKAIDNLKEANRLDVAARDPAALRELAIHCLGTEYLCFRQLGAWEGHTGPVTSVALSPDGKWAVSGSRDVTVRLWSVADGRSVAVLFGHTKPVTSVAFHPTGRLAASGSADGTVRLWDVGESAPSDVAPHVVELGAGTVRAVAFSPDGAWLAAGCEDGTIQMVPVTGGRAPSLGTVPRVLTGHAGPVTCLTFGPTRQLISGSTDRSIRVWDTGVGRQTFSWAVLNTPSSLMVDDYWLWYGFVDSLTLEGRSPTDGDIFRNQLAHTAGISQVRRLARTGLCLTASQDGTLKAWVCTRQGVAKEFGVARAEAGAVSSAAVNADGSRVVAGYADGRVRLWELAEPDPRVIVGGLTTPTAVFHRGRHLALPDRIVDYTTGFPGSVRLHSPPGIRGLATHPKEPRFAFGTDQGTVHVWDRRQRTELTRWPGHTQRVSAVAWDSDGDRLATASWDGTVKLWDGATDRARQVLEPGLGALHAVAWSGDGRHVATAGDRGAVVWDLKAGSAPLRLSNHVATAAGIAFGPGVVAHSAAGGTVEIRDLASGKVRHTLRGHTADVFVIAFSPDGRRLASAGADGKLRLWDAQTGREQLVLPLDSPLPRSLAFHPAGRYLVSCDRVGLVWDLQAGRAVARLLVDGGPVGFASDGSEFLIGVPNGSVQAFTLAEIERAWAAVQGKDDPAAPSGPVRVDVANAVVPGGHVDTVWAMAASPDGRWLATAGHDRTVKLWDAQTLELKKTLEGHGSIVWCVTFSPDSRYLASGSIGEKDGEVKVWEANTGRLRHDFRGHRRLVTGVAFHPTRPWLVSASLDGSVRVWDHAAGQSLGLLHQFDDPVAGLAFRPDGGALVAACRDHGVAMWDFGELPPLPASPSRTLKGHTSGVWSVRFSPDGRYLASGADHGVIILWDGASLTRVVTLPGTAGSVRSLSFSADGGLLSATAYQAGTIVWDLERLRRDLREMDLDW